MPSKGTSETGGTRAGLGRRSERVLHALRAEIERGDYPDGAQLPVEQELCERFGVSRNTIRRAVERLRLEGRVEVRQGAGTFVRSVPRERTCSQTVAVMSTLSLEHLVSIQRHLLQSDHLLCLYSQLHTAWDPEEERRFLERVRDERYRGLLAYCTPRPPQNREALRAAAREGVRVIHIDWYDKELPEESFLLPDCRHAGYMAGAILAAAGYREIRLVRPRTWYPSAEVFAEGFAQSCTDLYGAFDASRQHRVFPAGTPGDDEVMACLEPEGGGAAESVGYACTSVPFALALARAGQAHGVRVPESMGILGCMTPLDVNYIGDGEAVDRLDFDYLALLRRAIDRILAPAWQPIREQVKPAWIRQGTVRAPRP